jgi:hypothetical protein
LNKKIIYRVKSVKTPSINSQKTTSTTKSRSQIDATKRLEKRNGDGIQVTRHYHLIKQHIPKTDGSPPYEKQDNHALDSHAQTTLYNITEQYVNPETISSHDPYEVCISFYPSAIYTSLLYTSSSSPYILVRQLYRVLIWNWGSGWWGLSAKQFF